MCEWGRGVVQRRGTLTFPLRSMYLRDTEEEAMYIRTWETRAEKVKERGGSDLIETRAENRLSDCGRTRGLD